MSARDDYPGMVGYTPGTTLYEMAEALDEIDRLREDCATWEATVSRLLALHDEMTDRLRRRQWDRANPHIAAGIVRPEIAVPDESKP